MTEAEKKAQLKKHKALATGLFILMAVVYVLMVYWSQTSAAKWIGYVEAFSEAAMVGALADWFAVTALFRYPMGLKIPHTNLIEKSKNAIGENLGSFVKDNFLTAQTIRPYIEKLDVVSIANNWLAKPANQELLEEESMKFVEKIIRDLNDDEVVNFISSKGIEVLKQFDLQNLAASGLGYLVEKNKHTDLLNAILPKAKEFMLKSDVLIKDKLDEKHPIISIFAGKKISKGVVDGLVSFIEDVEKDEKHQLREQLENIILETADKIKTSAEWQEKLATMRDEFITPDRVDGYAKDLWLALKDNFQQGFEQNDSALRRYVRKNIQNLAQNLAENESLQLRLNGWIRLFIYRMILRNVGEVENLISNTVGNWSGRDLSNKLELEVGKDLQYIRVNGTLVGGLVGLLIYTLTQLLFYA
ncbi:DUF445 domain-containing protein [Vaginella massiliensis]|uniref:DUF445 domain-containing protein n=1 Tax=Vaginella massiliensis TaxID=1816680 RepID=UPI0008399F26|nr:DUF445 domain-containing protein [Vaginella massiliensis]